MKYLVVCKLDSPFLTEWLLFPSWENDGGDVVCIIDTVTHQYIMCHDWMDENDTPNWNDIEEDHL